MTDPTSLLILAIQSNVPAVWWGLPGVGKTALCAEAATTAGLTFVSVSAAYLDPSDIAGIPFPSKDDGLIMRRHDAWVDVVCSQPCLLLIDEINRAPRPVMNALLRLLQERLVGDRPLHAGTRLVATANPPASDRTAADLPSAAANRCVHIKGEPSFERWVAWMVAQSEGHGLVAAFIQTRPQMIDSLPKNPAEQSGAWASRRSWANAGTILTAGLASGNLDLALVAVQGLVGDGAGLEFATFMGEQDLPDPKKVLNAPDTFPLPQRMDKLFAVVNACVAEAHRQFTKEVYTAATTLLVRLGAGNARDIGALFIQRLLAGKDSTGRQPPGFVLPLEAGKTFSQTLKLGGVIK